LGEYRIFGLAPGRYYLSATYNQPMWEVTVDRSAKAQPEEGYVATYYPGGIDLAAARPRQQRRVGTAPTRKAISKFAACAPALTRLRPSSSTARTASPRVCLSMWVTTTWRASPSPSRSKARCKTTSSNPRRARWWCSFRTTPNAADDLESGAYMDPEVMKSFESKGVAMSIHENSRETAQLTLIPQ
jgi:hypothetical protein